MNLQGPRTDPDSTEIESLSRGTPTTRMRPQSLSGGRRGFEFRRYMEEEEE